MPAAEKITEGLKGPHGLAFDSDDLLFVAESRAGRICKVSEAGKVSPFASTGGRPTGIAFDDSGDLFVAENRRRHLLLISPDEAAEVYTGQCHGQRFSGPRDLCFTHEGFVLFTDAADHKTDAADHKTSGTLFRSDLNGEVERVATALGAPMGLVLSDDAVTLFVAEQSSNSVIRLELEEEGPAGNSEPFVQLQGAPWGLALDSQGMLLAAVEGVGVVVVDPEGKVVDTIEIPGARPTGMVFGGLDFDLLFVAEAEGGAIYRVQLEHAGQRPFAGPRSI